MKAPPAITLVEASRPTARPRSEPVPPKGEVLRPASLSLAAVGIWDEMAPICVAMGTLTVADRKSFATFCELQATLELASKAKADRSADVMRAELEDASDKESPYVIVVDAVLKLERDSASALRPFYEKFGLEPVGRARISVPKSKAPENSWQKMGLA